MAIIPPVPKNKVESRTVSYETLYQRALAGPVEPYPTYIFGSDRKVFLDIYQGEGPYGKPVVHNPDGSITHLPDPDLISQNP